MRIKLSTLVLALLAMAGHVPAYADSEVCRMANGYLDPPRLSIILQYTIMR